MARGVPGTYTPQPSGQLARRAQSNRELVRRLDARARREAAEAAREWDLRRRAWEGVRVANVILDHLPSGYELDRIYRDAAEEAS